MYDGFYAGKSLIQTGSGQTHLWGENTAEETVEIEGGTLTLESEVTMANTFDGANTVYGAGKLATAAVSVGERGKIVVSDGAVLQANGSSGAAHAVDVAGVLDARDGKLEVAAGETVNVAPKGMLLADQVVMTGATVNVGENSFMRAASPDGAIAVAASAANITMPISRCAKTGFSFLAIRR